MDPVLQVVLDGAAFRDLVAGREVVPAQQVPDRPAVHILLTDMGWDLMRLAIDEAEAAATEIANGEK